MTKNSGFPYAKPPQAPANPELALLQALRDALTHHVEGRFAPARQGYEAILADHPNSPEANMLFGALLDQTKEPEKALVHLDKAIALNPGLAEAHSNRGLALLNLDRPEDALTAFDQALALRPGYQDAIGNKGRALALLGRIDDAIKAHETALNIDPNNADAWEALGDTFNALEEKEKAVEAFKKACDLDDKKPGRLTKLGMAMAGIDQPELATNAFARAEVLSPDDVEAIAYQASLLEEANKLDEARAKVEQGLAKEPEHPRSTYVLSKLTRRAGDLDEALRLLTLPLWQTPQAKVMAATVAFEKGKLLDRMGDTAGAMAAFDEGNRLQRNAPAWKSADWDAYFTYIDIPRRTFSEDWVASWTPTPPETDPPPIFLFGFSRSGTTLMEQILESHDVLTVMDEKPALADVRRAFSQAPTIAAERLDGLAGLNADQIGQMRALYTQAAAHHMGRTPDGRLVDKNPLNTVNAGLIQRLWPSAPIIFALRHPCDVILSNYMQQFRPNASMIHTTSLDGTVRLYTEVMGLWQQYQALFPDMNTFIYRYEDLVTDFEGHMQRLLEFLGLPWDDSVTRYYETAKASGRVKTPSRDQVTEPIYTRAAGRWKHYEEALAPHMDALAPFIEAFGY